MLFCDVVIRLLPLTRTPPIFARPSPAGQTLSGQFLCGQARSTSNYWMHCFNPANVPMRPTSEASAPRRAPKRVRILCNISTESCTAGGGDFGPADRSSTGRHRPAVGERELMPFTGRTVGRRSPWRYWRIRERRLAHDIAVVELLGVLGPTIQEQFLVTDRRTWHLT